MFLSIKKLTIKITAVVATVLLITGATLGINKFLHNKSENSNADTVYDFTDENIPQTSNGINIANEIE